MYVYKILLPSVPIVLDYSHTDSLERGVIVVVSLRNKEELGIVWSLCEDDISTLNYKLKEIQEVLSLPGLNIELCEYIRKFANYTLAPLGEVLKLVLPLGRKVIGSSKFVESCGDERKTQIHLKSSYALTAEQQDIKTKLLAWYKGEKSYMGILLEGVPGSGKSELYMDLIADLLKQDGQALILVPEIALSLQLEERFRSKFKLQEGELHIWHSGIGIKEKRRTLASILRGDSLVLLGTRSALHLPYRDLRIIIVDEEHEDSYKQNEGGVIYNARDLAILRGSLEGCLVLLVSATPSIESYYNVKRGKYRHLQLTTSYSSSGEVGVSFIDLCKESVTRGELISKSLELRIKENILSGGQTLLYLNRRGFSPVLMCSKCYEICRCPQGCLSLVWHRGAGRLLCHLCGFTMDYPQKCLSCDEEGSYKEKGHGVEKLGEEVHNLFPEANTFIASSDTLNNLEKLQKFLGSMEKGEINIVIATQILAKGHHFPYLTLVCLVDIDPSLEGIDFRIEERSYQSVRQLAGRAGRGQDKGEIVIQTYVPGHKLFRHLESGSSGVGEFLESELRSREERLLPPIERFIGIIVSGRQESEVRKLCSELSRNSSKELSRSSISLFMPAPLGRVRGRYRYRGLLRYKEKDLGEVRREIRCWRESIQVRGDLRIVIDVDPYSFL